MKQSFNVGVATKFGVRSAVIVNVMIDFCKSAANCDEYKIDGKVYFPYSELRVLVPYMNKIELGVALRNLLNLKVIQVLNSPITGIRYTFTDYAKEEFRKKPIRIQIDWQ